MKKLYQRLLPIFVLFFTILTIQLIGTNEANAQACIITGCDGCPGANTCMQTAGGKYCVPLASCPEDSGTETPETPTSGTCTILGCDGCTGANKCMATSGGKYCVPDPACEDAEEVWECTIPGCEGCPSGQTCVIGTTGSSCNPSATCVEDEGEEESGGVSPEYEAATSTTLGGCEDDGDCDPGSTCEFQDPIGGPTGFFCRSIGATVDTFCDPYGDDCGPGFDCQFNDSIYGSPGFYCVPDGDECTGCAVCSIGRVGPAGGCPATQICGCEGTSCSCRVQEVDCEYTLEGCGDGADPLDPTAPASFSFDIIPWIRNMADLASGRSFPQLSGILYRIALPISIVIGMVMVGIAGLSLMTSEGDPSKAMNAKNQLTSAIIGLFVVLMGVGILRALINALFSGDGTITGL